MGNSTHPRLRISVALAMLVPSIAPAAMPPQSDSGWFPSRFVVQPVSQARSGVDIAAVPLLVRRDAPGGSRAGSPEADVSFGWREPVYRFTDGSKGPAIDVGLEAGMIARFALGQGSHGLVNSDFRVALPFGADFGAWEARAGLAHVSSHAGDDFLSQNAVFVAEASSRNGIEATVLRRILQGLRIAGGADYNFAAVNVESVRGWVGAAYDPPSRRSRIRPTGSLQLALNDYNPGLEATGSVGLAIRAGEGDVRIGLTGHSGPSAMGQFRAYDESYVGMFLTFVPGVVPLSGEDEEAP